MRKFDTRVLNDLNASLFGRTADAFATCCCALIGLNGDLRIANAGHLSPYCHGRELETPGGLPLGLAVETTYGQVDFRLMADDRLVFLSDGVVEARNKSGELYGFTRVAAVSSEPADLIAMAAQEFGQEDDITVLRVELA